MADSGILVGAGGAGGRGGGLILRDPPDRFTGATLAACITARNNYFTAATNAAALKQFQGNSNLAIILDPTGNDNSVWQVYAPGQEGNAYAASNWLDVSAVAQGDKGDKGDPGPTRPTSEIQTLIDNALVDYTATSGLLSFLQANDYLTRTAVSDLVASLTGDKLNITQVREVIMNSLGNYITEGDLVVALRGYLALAGGTLTGQTKGIAPTEDEDLATKSYVDQRIQASGGTIPIPQDAMFFGLSDDAVPETAEATIAAVNGVANLPQFTNKHIIILRLASESDIESVIFSDDDSHTNQVGAFTKYGSTVTRSSMAFAAWVSNQVLTHPNAIQMTVR